MKKKSKQGSKAAVLPTTEVTTTCREDRRFRAGLLFHEKSKQSCYAYLAEVRQSQNSCTVMDNKTKPDCFHWPLNFLDLIFFFSPECAIHEVRSFPKKVNKLQQSHVLLLNRSSSLQRRGGTGQGTHSSQPTSNLLLQEMEWPEWGVWFQSNLYIFSQS